MIRRTTLARGADVGRSSCFHHERVNRWHHQCCLRSFEDACAMHSLDCCRRGCLLRRLPVSSTGVPVGGGSLRTMHTRRGFSLPSSLANGGDPVAASVFARFSIRPTACESSLSLEAACTRHGKQACVHMQLIDWKEGVSDCESQRERNSDERRSA